jgi:hypothetical protein
MNHAEGTSMSTEISLLAIDLAKGSFQVCAVGPDGAVLHNRALSRTRLAALLAEHPNAFGEKPVLKLMFGAMIRAAERWRAIKITTFERRQ